MYGRRRYRTFAVCGALTGLAVIAASVRAQDWTHPAGLLDVATIEEMKHKSETLDWARRLADSLDAGVQLWLTEPIERLEELMPKRKMSVYWLMICPDCRRRLPFEPFDDFRDSSIARLDGVFSSTVTMPWLHWMDMDDQEGHLLWHAAGAKLPGLDALPAEYRKRAEAEYPDRMTVARQ